MMRTRNLQKAILLALFVAVVHGQSVRRKGGGIKKSSVKLPPKSSRVRGIKGARSLGGSILIGGRETGSILTSAQTPDDTDRAEDATSQETINVDGDAEEESSVHVGSILKASTKKEEEDRFFGDVEDVEGAGENVVMMAVNLVADTVPPETEDPELVITTTTAPTEVDSVDEGVPNFELEEEGDTGIIGGITANDDEFPFYVKFEGGTLCGGSLISPDTVLTAAHCVDQGPPRQVRIGPNSYYGGEVIDTKCAAAHQDFIENDKTLMNDVAIIKLKNPVTDTSKLIAINGDSSYPSTSGTPLTVIGFGLTSNSGGDVSTSLQKLETDFVTIDECVDTYSEKVVTPDSHICADVRGAGDCNGDSGGPVFDQNRVQVGIVSFGYGGCASNQYQDVYVNIANFAEWIVRHAMGDNCKPFEGELPQPGGGSSSQESSGTTDTGGADSGTNVETTPSAVPAPAEAEDEITELDAFLDCFSAGIQLLQVLMGGSDGKGAGAGGGGGGGGDGKGNQDDGKGKGFFRSFVDGVIEGVGDALEGGALATAGDAGGLR
ncbi:Trypsin delta/gamma-like protein CG30031 [Seminavis robusta]|uniref:Trypsin delta/gamma-like protein CG30031 n=1 Tax=Seminavis robusta TaxID=568900 RepID=A0A9N8E735_9STRA|nr:Trypsin delta/gamma-like protein CG30031 [Seminavis robusta]|eukprot:Sro720_g192520.1 Trypsin delta/gamma-like protein CG30031 (549) ;mRNA; r:8502-10338